MSIFGLIIAFFGLITMRNPSISGFLHMKDVTGVLITLLIMFFSATLIVSFFQTGIKKMILSQLDYGHADFSAMFTAFIPFIKMLGAGILFQIVMMIIMGIIGVLFHLILQMQMPMENVILIVLSNIPGLLYIAVIIFLLIRILIFLPYVYIDQEAGFFDGIGISWEMTKGNFWLLFILGLVCSIIISVGMFLLLIGTVPAIAIVYSTMAHAYRSISGQGKAYTADSAPQPVPYNDQFPGIELKS